jgi:hypothetical protein
LFAAEKSPPPQFSGPRVPEAKMEFVPLDAPEAAEVRLLGERAINRLAYSLVTEVSRSVSQQGEADALGTCHLKNVRLDGGVLPDMPRVAAWKRTSLRIRDSANAPDPADMLALHRVLADVTAGNIPPKILVQRIEYPGGAPEWRVYKPVAALGQCLACHGPADDLSADVRAELKRRYPNDAAVGYQQGEWRGLIRVSIGPAPASLPAPAPTPAPPRKR